MNFALLGDDLAVLPVAQAMKDHPQHDLTHAALVTTTQAELMKTAPSVRIIDGWEELMSVPSVDAVLVAGSSPKVLEGAKQLAASGKPLLLFPTAEQEATLIYELSLIHDDTSVTLFPVIPLRFHPKLKQVRELIQSGALGAIRHMQMQREIQTGKEKEPSPFLSWADVDAALLQDADLLRSLGGNYNRVTALAAGTAEDRFALMTVTLAGDNLPEATWSLKAVSVQAGWQLSLTTENGSVVLSGANEPSSITLKTEGVDLPPIPDPEAESNIGSEILAQFEKAVTGISVQPNWTDLMRAFETVEATHRSVRRRRTIELHFDSQSERSLFKTQMTAIGCGLLTLTFFAVLVVLLIGAMFDPKTMSQGTVLAMKIARIAVFLPVFLFLLFQMLLFITRPSSS
jgi:predicted dehydrogenase